MSELQRSIIEYQASVLSPPGVRLGQLVSKVPGAQPHPHLTAFDLLELANWAAAAEAVGIDRVEVHDGLPSQTCCDPSFVVMYEHQRPRPSYALTREEDGYHLCRMPSGIDVGVFVRLDEALAAVRSDPRRRVRATNGQPGHPRA